MTTRPVSLLFALLLCLVVTNSSAEADNPPDPATASPVDGTALPPDGSSPDEEKEKRPTAKLLQAYRTQVTPYFDTRMAIVEMLMEVKGKRLSPENFYRQVSKLPMPEGKELRHVLMEVKKDIGNHLGDSGLIKVFGENYKAGGSSVEEKILKYRLDLVMNTIQEVVVKYSKINPTATMYYAEVGGWPKEASKEMKFAGDIDFNFLSGDLESAQALKKMFDDAIKAKFNGVTPEQLDIPCTVHGMGTDEVYVGRHGQTFAEAVTKSVKLINFIASESKSIGIDKSEPVEFKKALRTMLWDARYAKMRLADLDTAKFPSEPGLTLEMIRHFEHDIVGKDVYTYLESFVKAAKYADRSFTAIHDDGVLISREDAALRRFTQDLVRNKKDPAALVELVEKYYKDIGKPLPFDADLFSISEDGLLKAQMKVNEDVIRAFWDDVRGTMWKGAIMKLDSLVAEYRQKLRSGLPKDSPSLRKLHKQLMQYNEIIEVEDRVLQDSKAGVKNLPPEYTRLIGEFRKMILEYKRTIAGNHQLRFIDPMKGTAYKFIKAQLEMKNESSVRMATATLLSAVSPTTVNDMLDYLDSRLLDNLRTGRVQQGYEEFLNKGVKKSWDEKARAYLEKRPPGAWYKDYAIELNQRRENLNKWFNDQLTKSCTVRGIKVLTTPVGQAAGSAVKSMQQTSVGRAARSGLKGVQQINKTFSASVAASPAGQKAMKGMMLYNLQDEIPLYLEFMMNEDWDGLATEFFRRRVPFGSAVERGYMGDYYGVAWEATATMIPPFAIASAAASISHTTAQFAWDTYWADELELFIDELYEAAEFEVSGVKEIGENLEVTTWKLVNIRYREQDFDIDDLIETESADARKMHECLQMNSDDRTKHFPLEAMNNGLFQWYDNNRVLKLNLRKTDPWIQLIEEMENYEHVGIKLKDFYYYQKQARWEQLKVKFLKHVKEQLVKRRHAEDNLLDGNLPKLYAELVAVAEQLDVVPQIEASLENQFGGDFYFALTWLNDYRKGVSRKLQGKVDVWDVYGDYTIAVTDYLDAYKKILDGREQTETTIPLHKRDQGLRIVTGPYFLDGIARQDVENSERWFTYPAQAASAMTTKMGEIKAAAKASPMALDLKEGAYDRGVLDRLVNHDTFREMWKHVNGRFDKVSVPSYLGSGMALQGTPQQPGDIKPDQDRSLARFKYHEESTEKLLNDFRTHYGLKKDDELTQLREARDRIVSLSEETCELCTSPTGDDKSDKARAGTGQLAQDPFSTHENKIRDAVRTARRINTIVDELNTYQGRAKVYSEAIKVAKTTVVTAANRVCDMAEEMEQCKTNDQRDDIYYRASSAHGEIKPAYESSADPYKKLAEIGRLVKARQEEINEAKLVAESISGMPDDLTSMNNSRSAAQDNSAASLAQAKEKLATLVSEARSAHSLHAEAKGNLSSRRGTAYGNTLQGEMERIMGEIDAADQNAHACVKVAKHRYISGKLPRWSR